MTEKIVGELESRSTTELENPRRKETLDLLQPAPERELELLELDKENLSPETYTELKRLFMLPPVSPEIQKEDDYIVSLLIDIVNGKLNKETQ